jgi:beta-hydroxylase
VLQVLAALALLALLQLAAVLYLWLRCARREPFWRHALRRSSLLALYNAFVYLASALPDRPYQDAGSFDELAPLRERWREIRDEALALVARGGVGAPAWCNDPAIAAFFERGWTRFYLRWHGEVLPSARSACPRTVELLQALPTVRGAMLALLPAQARIEAHTDPFAGGLRFHLGLSVPAARGCTLSVDGDRRTWREGEALVFDETYLHEVANETHENRLILFCDVERPLRWRWAHALHRPVRAFLMSWTAIQNVETDPVGRLGRAFEWVNRPLRKATRGNGPPQREGSALPGPDRSRTDAVKAAP